MATTATKDVTLCIECKNEIPDESAYRCFCTEECMKTFGNRIDLRFTRTMYSENQFQGRVS